jgi:hypothetical protein
MGVEKKGLFRLLDDEVKVFENSVMMCGKNVHKKGQFLGVDVQ